jgi:hypothetical protein
MRAWCYHVPVPPEHARIDYPDVRMDQGAFDYERLLNYWSQAAVEWADDWLIERGYPGIDASSPMYERVVAMNDYVNNSTFLDQPAVFLDSDAFLNADTRHIFDGDWDVGLTYRHNMGASHALNEGVIFANNRRPAAVRSFFRAYLDTYHAALEDADLVAKYGNLKRWRGGQLSLNRLACPQGLPTALDYREIAGARVTYFPCFRWNYPVDAVDHRLWDTKAVLHLKGARKHLLPEIIRYQEGRNG